MSSSRPFQVVGIALTLGTADWGTDKGVRTGCSLTMRVGLSQPDWPRQNAEAQKHKVSQGGGSAQASSPCRCGLKEPKDSGQCHLRGALCWVGDILLCDRGDRVRDQEMGHHCRRWVQAGAVVRGADSGWLGELGI